MLVSPGGRITVTLPPSAVIIRLCGTWVNARVTSPPPESMLTALEATPLASTLPPSVGSWTPPLRPLAVRPLAVKSPPPVSSRMVPVPVSAQLPALTLPPSVAI